jgi:hypothetical protein
VCARLVPQEAGGVVARHGRHGRATYMWQYNGYNGIYQGENLGNHGFKPEMRGKLLLGTKVCRCVHNTGKWIDHLNFPAVFLLIWRGFPMKHGAMLCR